MIEYTTPPLYSDEARRRGIEGVVVVRTQVDLDGRATQSHVVTGLGYGLDQNALVINTGDKLVLVDTGTSNVFAPTLGRMSKHLAAAGVDPGTVDVIIITHMHPDHTAGLLTPDKAIAYQHGFQTMVAGGRSTMSLDRLQAALSIESALKMGRAVRYRAQDVEEYERQALVDTQGTPDHGPM